MCDTFRQFAMHLECSFYLLTIPKLKLYTIINEHSNIFNICEVYYQTTDVRANMQYPYLHLDLCIM